MSLSPSAPALHTSTAAQRFAAAPLSRTAAAAIASPRSSDCDYAGVVVGTIIGLGFGVLSLDPIGGLPLSPGETTQSVLDQLRQLVAMAKAVTPPAGLESFHADLIAAYETFLNALPPAAAALNAGDSQTAHDIVDAASKALDGATNDLQQKYPDVTLQIDACT